MLRLATIIFVLLMAAPFRAATPPDASPADLVKFGGLTAERAVKEATFPPGFKMHVFAAEPDVIQPIAFCLDERGRVWVAEGITYPRRRGNPPRDGGSAGSDRSQPTPEQMKDIFGGADRILVLEDTDGDHKFDKRTVFLENVNLISGLQIGFGGVWIGAAPYLMFVPVGDWDNPKPSGDPKILLDGWNYTADTHETLNTFTWGPDGWLYGCHGVFCPSNVGKPGVADAERQWMDAGVWRYHPIKHSFEVFTEGGSNPWGIDFNEEGQLFAEMCVIPHFWHMIHGARIERQGGEHFSMNRDEIARNERHRDPRNRKPNFPYVYEDIKQHGDHVHWTGSKGPHAANARSDAAGGGHAHAGVMCYLGQSWPAEYRGKLFLGNIHGQRLNMDIPERKGGGYVGRHGSDFMNFNDTWSQTLNQLYDQDGSVYIIDWYDKNQCHHNREDGHDRSNGRIYKIVYNNQKPTRVDLRKKRDDDLLDLALSKNEWMSRNARRLLQERSPQGALNGDKARRLFRRAQGLSSAEELRVLWTMHLMGGVITRDLLQKQSEWTRAWAIQLALENRTILPEVLKEMVELSRTEKSALVRLYLASALQRLPLQDRWDIYTALLARAEDADDHNLPLMLWYGGEALSAAEPARALPLAVNARLPKILNFTTRRIASLSNGESRDLISATLASLNDPLKQLDMLNGLSAALKGQRSVPMPKGWGEVESKLMGSLNAQIRALVQSLSVTFGSAKAVAALKRTLMDPAAELSMRRTALDSLVSARDSSLPELLQGLLNDRDLRSQAIRALASSDDARTPKEILKIFATLDAPEKKDALATLASRVSFAKHLLAAVENKTIPPSILGAEIIRQLHNLKDADVAEALQKVYGKVRDSAADKQQEIERYRRIYRAGGSQPGEATRGRVVYARTCQQCHTLFDAGGKVGPDLTGSNRNDLDYILQNMVDPNAVIPNEYRTSTIETTDERIITGIVNKQDEKSLTVTTANEVLVLPRKEVKSTVSSDISMMPEGLLANLTDQEVRDLIYYLGRPGQVPLTTTAAP
jgi:putative membrane-bound dehydrogenase-like protein